MALISERAGRARTDRPPRLLGGEASVERADGETWIALRAERAYEREIEPGSDLVFALEAVASPRDAARFVERYGLLRSGPDALPGAAEIRESFSEWQFEIARIRMIATYVLLTHRALDRRHVAIADPEAVSRLREYADLGGVEHRDLDDLDVLRVVSHAVQKAVNDRLGESRWAIATSALPDGRPNVFSFVAEPTTPGALAYAYWQLADLIVARAPLAQCEGCGRFFERHDARQRFHDDACRQRFAYERRKQAGDARQGGSKR